MGSMQMALSCVPALRRSGLAEPLPRGGSQWHRYVGATRSRQQLLARVPPTCAPRASASPSPGADDPSRADPSSDPAADHGSEAWRERPASLALPDNLKSPGAWFVLAGVLKVMFLMYASTPVSHMLTVFGSPILGTMLTVLPVAIGLGLLARMIVQRGLHKHRLFLPVALLAVLLFCGLCSAFTEATTPTQPTIKATTVTRTVP